MRANARSMTGFAGIQQSNNDHDFSTLNPIAAQVLENLVFSSSNTTDDEDCKA